jgi:hypothetical protein
VTKPEGEQTKNLEVLFLGRAQATMDVVGRDKLLATCWASILRWSVCQCIEQNIHSLAEDALNVQLVVLLLPEFRK